MSENDSQRPQDAGNAGETQQQPRVQVESTPADGNIPYVQAYDTQTGKPLGSQQVVNKHTVVKTKTKKLPIFITALAGCACGALLVIALIMSGTLNIGGGKNAVTAGASGSSTQKITIDSEDTTLAEAVSAKALPSVVSITATSSGSQNGSLSQSADESDSSGSVGSGVVLDTEGHILTNNHVVDGYDQYVVTMDDGTTYEAEFVGNDASSDLAVIKLKGDLKSPILCLYGPPGVGKTSLGKSVAAALGRKFGRISLGGLHDESEIRGHRRTYIGAMPGRIIQTIKRCGSSNPVIILDEVDKVTVSNHGDPSSALLEVLDPEQNTTFHDNYIDMEYDLSKVLFIATANNVANIAPALRDRMEMINIPGYLVEEKIRIALDHLLPKQREAHGIKEQELVMTPQIVEGIISGYTRESGVRSLDKLLAKIARARAKQIAFDEAFAPEITAKDVEKILGMPKFLREEYEVGGMTGVVTGLAWTEVGGDILYIESVLTPGKGKVSLTGNLGEVMKESATIAHEWVMAHHKELGIDPEMFEKNDINIHVPEGAIPKDGPSAGITMVTSIVSTYTGRKVRERIAMTGETTLRGRVMPVGGIKEKILAAKRAGIKELILSEDNRKDISEIKAEYIDGLTFHYVRTNEDVLRLALEEKK